MRECWRDIKARQQPCSLDLILKKYMWQQKWSASQLGHMICLYSTYCMLLSHTTEIPTWSKHKHCWNLCYKSKRFKNTGFKYWNVVHTIETTVVSKLFQHLCANITAALLCKKKYSRKTVAPRWSPKYGGDPSGKITCLLNLIEAVQHPEQAGKSVLGRLVSSQWS